MSIPKGRKEAAETARIRLCCKYVIKCPQTRDAVSALFFYLAMGLFVKMFLYGTPRYGPPSEVHVTIVQGLVMLQLTK
jgi:hypothetical protein